MLLPGNKLSDFQCAEKTNFILGLITELSNQCGGYHYFWAKENAQDRLNGWIEGLSNVKTITIINGFEAVLDGQYLKGTDTVPRSPLDFKHFIKSGSFNKIDNANLLEDKASFSRVLTDDERKVARNAIDEMKKILRVNYS